MVPDDRPGAPGWRGPLTPVLVTGPSMAPTLRHGDAVLVRRGGRAVRPGDIVREVNGETITSAAQLEEIAGQDTRWWRFTVERDGKLMRQMLRY